VYCWHEQAYFIIFLDPAVCVIQCLQQVEVCYFINVVMMKPQNEYCCESMHSLITGYLK